MDSEDKNTEKKIYFFDSHPRALEALKKRLTARAFDPNEYHIILTPDRYTQSVESALFENGGAIDCEVLTLSRLAFRVCPLKRSISREGGVMITARAIERVRSGLSYYGSAARFPDFAREVYETLQQISSSGADIREAASVASGATRIKLNDLALIKDAYDGIKSGGGDDDASDRIEALISAAPTSDLIRNSRFYAVGFSDPTRLNVKALDAVKRYARAFTEFYARETTGKREEMTLVSASDRIEEYKEIARRICAYVKSADGARRYGDVSIICAEPRALERILREYGIAVYADESTPLFFTPPCEAISDIRKLSDILSERKILDCATLVSLCKNPYSGCNPDCAELLQSYFARRKLTFIERDCKFTMKSGEETITVAGAARALDRALLLLDEYDGHESFSSAVKAVAERGAFSDIFEAARSDGYGDTDAVTPLIALADLLEAYGSGNKSTDADAMFSAARAVQVKSVPRERDCVTIAMPRSFRLTACKLLIVADFNEGTLPPASPDTGLLCDDELNSLDDRIEPTVREINRRNRAELRAAVYNADAVECFYSEEDNAKPAAFIYDLAASIHKYSRTKELAVLRHDRTALMIEYNAPTRAAARECAALGLTEFTGELSLAAGKSDMTAPPFEPYAESAKRKNRLSSTELSAWFECPYKRFLRYVVGLNERPRQNSAADFGTIVHKFMELFMKCTPYDLSRDNIERLVDEALALNDVYIDPKTRRRIIDNAADYAAENVRIVNAGKYRPEKFEYERLLPAYLGKTDKADFTIKVDRIDAIPQKTDPAEDGDAAKVGSGRVIDYKTGGSASFSYDSCADGTEMQLPLYAGALGALGEYDVTGMFYVKLRKRYLSKKSLSLDGCIVCDPDIAVEYDSSLGCGVASKVIPVKFNKSLGADGRPTIYRGETKNSRLYKNNFDALIARCKANADTAADEIRTGYIARSPSVGACGRCPYRGLCGDASERGGPKSCGGAEHSRFDGEGEDDE